jgi:protoheme IX farnesyltransferase
VANTELLGAPQSASSAPPVSSTGGTTSLVSFVRDLIALTKPRITAVVLLTEAAGAHLAPGTVSARDRWLSLIGTALVVGSANALNMWWERDVDAHMSRTRNRPLPAGRMSPDVALGFGLLLAAISVPMLFCVNAMTGLLGLVSLIGYVAVYTPLKRYSYLALLVGAVPGAIPPLLGWSTVTGTIGLGGFLLFVFLFIWQIPHFAAITIFRTEEYRRAGLQVVSVQHGEAGAKRMIAGWTVLLVASSLSFGVLGMAGRGYELAAALFGAAFLALVFRGPQADDRRGARWAKRVFAFSIPYLVILLLTLVFDRIAT